MDIIWIYTIKSHLIYIMNKHESSQPWWDHRNHSLFSTLWVSPWPAKWQSAEEWRKRQAWAFGHSWSSHDGDPKTLKGDGKNTPENTTWTLRHGWFWKRNFQNQHPFNYGGCLVSTLVTAALKFPELPDPWRPRPRNAPPASDFFPKCFGLAAIQHASWIDQYTIQIYIF